jgi:hypothetical protein
LILSGVMAATSCARCLARAVLEQQPRHQAGQGPPRPLGQRPPDRGARAARRRRRDEQVGLRNSAPRRLPAAVSAASHGPLPDSGRGSLPPLPRPKHPSARSLSPPPTAAARRKARQRRPAVGTPRPGARRPPARTSKPAPRGTGRRPRRGGTATQSRSLFRSPHGRGRRDRSTDATGTRASVPWSCGRSAVELYNTARPHSSLGYRPPAPEVVTPALPMPPPRPGSAGAAPPPAAMLH